MTAKSRKRKLEHKLRHSQPSITTFYFSRGIEDIAIEAESEEHAQRLFQERYGYFPEPA